MTADTITNQIIRLQRRRLVIQRIHQDGQLTRDTIAAIYRTTKPANRIQLIRWSINDTRHKLTRHDAECDCDECEYKRTRSKQ